MRLIPKPQPVRGDPECEHARVGLELDMARLTDSDGNHEGQFAADIRVKCLDCKAPFRFKGLPGGYSPDRTMVGINGEELRAAMEPAYVEELMKP